MVYTQMLMPLLGGMLIGSGAMLLMLFNGRITGVSGILHGALKPFQEGGWRLFFIAGLLLSGVIAQHFYPANYAIKTVGLPLVLLAGFLVGVGARYGGGCTSGHGVCGIGRLSVRSMIATGVFMATAALTASAFH